MCENNKKGKAVQEQDETKLRGVQVQSRSLLGWVIYRLGIDGSGASPGHTVVHAIHDAFLALIVDAVVLVLRVHSVHRVAGRLILHHAQHGGCSCHHAREGAIGSWGARLNHSRKLGLNRGAKSSKSKMSLSC